MLSKPVSPDNFEPANLLNNKEGIDKELIKILYQSAFPLITLNHKSSIYQLHLQTFLSKTN